MTISKWNWFVLYSNVSVMHVQPKKRIILNVLWYRSYPWAHNATHSISLTVIKPLVADDNLDGNVSAIYHVIVPMFSWESKYNPRDLEETENLNTTKEHWRKTFCCLFSALAAKNKLDIEEQREKVQGYRLTKPKSRGGGRQWWIEAGGEEQEGGWSSVRGSLCGL